jgi:hypothetical protein
LNVEGGGSITPLPKKKETEDRNERDVRFLGIVEINDRTTYEESEMK